MSECSSKRPVDLSLPPDATVTLTVAQLREMFAGTRGGSSFETGRRLREELFAAGIAVRRPAPDREDLMTDETRPLIDFDRNDPVKMLRYTRIVLQNFREDTKTSWPLLKDLDQQLERCIAVNSEGHSAA